jgi:tetratricopeptide (TPR) repeat protein
VNQLDQQGKPELPKSPGVLLFMYLLIRNLPGWIYYHLRRYTLGVSSCSRVIARYPNPGALNIRGLCYLKLEDWSAAYADFDQALVLSQAPAHPVLFNNRGYAAYKLGRYTEALIDLDQAIASYVAHKLGRLDQAITIGTEHRRALINRIMVYCEVQREEDALRDYNLLLARNPKPADFVGRAGVYIQMGRYEDALADCTQALELKPGYYGALYNMACVRSLQGEIESALVLLRQAIAANATARAQARTDPDLIALREEPEFRALVGAAE